MRESVPLARVLKGLPLILLALVLLTGCLDSKGPAIGRVITVTSGTAQPQLSSAGWPPCRTLRQRQQWAVSVASAQPDLARLPVSAAPESPAPTGTLQTAVRSASAIVVAHAVAVGYDSIVDGSYIFVVVSVELSVEQTIKGSVPQTITLSAGTLTPDALCAPVLQPASGRPLILPPVRVLLLFNGPEPEPVTGTYRLDGGVVSVPFNGGFAPSINGLGEQEFIDRVRSLAQ